MSNSRHVPYEAACRIARLLAVQMPPVTAEKVQRVLGYGARRQIQRHLNAWQREATPRTPRRTAPPVVQAPPPPPPRSRAEDVAALDAWIATRRAQGYGHSLPQVRTNAEPEEEDEGQGKEGRKRVLALRLVRSLVDEVVPWLPRHQEEP